MYEKFTWFKKLDQTRPCLVEHHFFYNELYFDIRIPVRRAMRPVTPVMAPGNPIPRPEMRRLRGPRMRQGCGAGRCCRDGCGGGRDAQAAEVVIPQTQVAACLQSRRIAKCKRVQG